MKYEPNHLIAVLSLLAAGCGADSQPPGMTQPPAPAGSWDVPHAGGTRLKAVVAEAADGTRHFFHWRDTELDVPCTFQSVGGRCGVEAGVGLRCVPTGDAVAAVQELLFADAGCGSPVASLAPSFSSTCEPPRFAFKGGTGTTCDPSPAFFRLKERLTEITAVWRQEGAACVPATLPAAAAGSGLHRLEKLEFSAMTGAILQAGPVKDGIAPVQLQAEDGARAYLGLRDAAGSFDCTVAGTTAGPRCVPNPAEGAVIAGLYADAECNQPAAMALGCALGERLSIPFGFESGYAEGQSILRVFRGGRRLPTGYARVGTGCLPHMPLAGVFALGEEIPPSSFLPGTIEKVIRPSGLSEEVERAGGWSRPRPGTLKLDGSQPYPCLFAETSDGILRCLPRERFRSDHFADSGCSVPLAMDDGPAATVLERDRCPARGRIFSRGKRHLGDVFTKLAGGCEKTFHQSSDTNKFEYHLVGPEIPGDRFVAMPIVLR